MPFPSISDFSTPSIVVSSSSPTPFYFSLEFGSIKSTLTLFYAFCFVASIFCSYLKILSRSYFFCESSKLTFSFINSGSLRSVAKFNRHAPFCSWSITCINWSILKQYSLTDNAGWNLSISSSLKWAFVFLTKRSLNYWSSYALSGFFHWFKYMASFLLSNSISFT